MRVQAEVERRKGLASIFFRGLLIEIWIGVFIIILAFYLVFRLSLSGSCLSFAILSRKFGRKFPKNFETTDLFDPPSPWGFCLSRKLRRVRQQMIPDLAH